MNSRVLAIILLIRGLLFADSLHEDYFKNIPKVELHMHLGGSYPQQYLFSIASKEQRKSLKYLLKSVEKRINYHDVFKIFEIISKLIDSEEKVERGVEALCMDLMSDGISYAEIRTGLKDLGGGFENYLRAVLEGIKKSENSKLKANVILSLQRHSSLEIARKTIDLALKYRNLGVVGIDISGDSTKGDIELILPELMRAKREEIPFVIHMGESMKEKDQIKLLKLLEPKRIGHGVFLSKEAKDWILKRRIPVEICLSSSVLVKMIEEYKKHPGIELLRQGHPVTFCMDDPLLFSTTLSKELKIAHEIIGLSIEDIEKISINSFDHAIERIGRPYF